MLVDERRENKKGDKPKRHDTLLHVDHDLTNLYLINHQFSARFIIFFNPLLTTDLRSILVDWIRATEPLSSRFPLSHWSTVPPASLSLSARESAVVNDGETD